MTDLPLPGSAPPAPPPPPPEGWRAPVPVSGKAVASLVCGVGGLVICVLLAPVGLVLGAIAMGETGREGTRGGRGFAIAGTVVSLLAIVGNIIVFGFFFGVMPGMLEDEFKPDAEQLNADAKLIVERVQEYYLNNNDSLGPGGPVLGMPEDGYDSGYDTAPAVEDGRVAGSLEIEHLMNPGESHHYQSMWSLAVTSRERATLTAYDWDGNAVLEWQITDAGKGRYIEVPRSTNR